MRCVELSHIKNVRFQLSLYSNNILISNSSVIIIQKSLLKDEGGRRLNGPTMLSCSHDCTRAT